jgi:glycerol kinase
MMNIGSEPAIMKSGALTTAIAFNYGGKVHYQTEGNITCSCDTLVWLCREMGMFENADEIEKLAGTVEDAMGVCLVPALSGLGAPFFDVDARAIICGLSRGTTKAHVARAALESVAQRDADVVEAMAAFTGSVPAYMMADGGGAKNALMMQLQADLAGCEVRCSAAGELSALGAAYMAGLKVGVYADLDSIPARHAPMRVYKPEMDISKKNNMRAAWAKAIERARLR